MRLADRPALRGAVHRTTVVHRRGCRGSRGGRVPRRLRPCDLPPVPPSRSARPCCPSGPPRPPPPPGRSRRRVERSSRRHRPGRTVRGRPPGGALPGAVRFRWPLDGVPRPVRRFDPPPRPWLPGHRGVDLAAAPGATVRAAGAGTVLFAGLVAGRPVVTVGHADGLRTTHEPVSPAVRPGETLAAGAPLGTLLAGHPGCPAPGLPALGAAARRRLPGSAGPARPGPRATAAARRGRPRPQRWASSGGSRTESRSYSSGVL